MQTTEFQNCFSLEGSLLKSVRKLINSAGKIVVISHQNPDGDAVGSALGLALALKRMGKEISVVLPDAAPDFLEWMPGYDLVITHDRAAKRVSQIFQDAELMIAVDLSQTERMGDLSACWVDSKIPSIHIDHHPGSGGFATHSIIHTGCGSTSEMIYHFLDQLGWLTYLDRDAGTCLLTGIITDTLGFKVASSYPGVFGVVMELMKLGADKDQVFDRVYNQSHEGRLRLLGFSLSERMKVYPEEAAACIFLTYEDMNRFNFQKGDSEGFVNYPLTIRDIKLSVLFTQQTDHIKLSLRSKGDLDVNIMAETWFHGGGHKNAAGGRFWGTMEEALQRFEEVIRNQ